MQAITLIGPSDWDWASMKERTVQDEVARYDVGPARFVIEFKDGHVAFNHDPDLSNEYEEDELGQVPFSRPVFVSVEYTSRPVLQRVIIGRVVPDDVWLDDDNHAPLPAKHFREEVEANPRWDWRK
jgi:hypothetical protein